ncbi:hypothetical protein Taro_033127 [Colocasia esculenta]|uniref:Uncharacterized protein n=1 Tax=Colocasia esculenta TaxID=4460 RepID=A0A843W847_COLES|nr:hypothetical protein [Colocasia esculenta]
MVSRGADVDSGLTSRWLNLAACDVDVKCWRFSWRQEGLTSTDQCAVFRGNPRAILPHPLLSFSLLFPYVLLQHFRLLMGARGKVVMRVAVADRAGNDGSDGGSCEKLLGVRRESSWRLVQLLEAEELFRGKLDGEIYTVRFFSAVEPARFQFSQCAPEGDAYNATGSCVLYRLLTPFSPGVRVRLSRLWSLVSPVLVLLDCCECFGSWVSGSGFGLLVGYWRLEMPSHHSRLGLNHRTSVSCSALWRSGTLEKFREGVELLSFSVDIVGLAWCGPEFLVVSATVFSWSRSFVPRSEVAMFVVGRCSRLIACDLGGCAEGCLRVVADSVGFVGVVRMVYPTLVRHGVVVVFAPCAAELGWSRCDLLCPFWLVVLLCVACAVEPARFQFSQCAPEGDAYYATGSCVLYRLCSCAAFEAVEPCLSGAGLAWLL